LLVGVTVLTSMDILALRKIGVRDSMEKQVLRLARLALESGLDALVTSPLELEPVRREVGGEMVMVTPGVRPAGIESHDQKRVGTPGEARRAGADFLVVGRPIYDAVDRAAMAAEIMEDIERGSGTTR
jgi:orotidine-5'-phosphate decarboxylase